MLGWVLMKCGKGIRSVVDFCLLTVWHTNMRWIALESATTAHIHNHHVHVSFSLSEVQGQFSVTGRLYCVLLCGSCIDISCTPHNNLGVSGNDVSRLHPLDSNTCPRHKWSTQ